MTRWSYLRKTPCLRLATSPNLKRPSLVLVVSLITIKIVFVVRFVNTKPLISPLNADEPGERDLGFFLVLHCCHWQPKDILEQRRLFWGELLRSVCKDIPHLRSQFSRGSYYLSQNPGKMSCIYFILNLAREEGMRAFQLWCGCPIIQFVQQ